MSAKRKRFILRPMGLIADATLVMRGQFQPVEPSIMYPP